MLAFKSPSGVPIRLITSQTVRVLMQAEMDAILALLASDPVRGVHLQSMLQDNGLENPANRGSFYGYFENDKLVGIALLGHATMVFARPDVEIEALQSFANTVRTLDLNINLMFGPKAQVEMFGELLAATGRATKLVREMQSYVCTKPKNAVLSLQIQRANADNAKVVSEAHAQLFIEATGADPRAQDSEGFYKRVEARIERKRTWIKLDNEEVVFKAELQSITPEVAYLEGIWTREDKRKQGIAGSCLNELVHRLLKQQLFVTLVVDENEQHAVSLYEKIGFKYASEYQARYFHPVSAE